MIDDTTRRLGNIKTYEKFLLLFPDDKTIYELRNNLERHDTEKAFLSAHTLKGLASSLGLTPVTELAAEMTELLRIGRLDEATELMDMLFDNYTIIIDIIEAE